VEDVQATAAPVEPAAPAAEVPSLPAQALPEGALRIVALGDSLTQGDGDESGLGGYPARLAQRLEAERPGTQILNLGRSGWTSADLLNGVNGEPGVIPEALAFDADLALIWIGSNDLWYLYEYGPEPATAEAEQQDLASYAANLEAMVQQFTAAGTVVCLALLDDQSLRPVVANPPNPAEPAFTAISKDDLARMSIHAQALNAIIREVAGRYGARVADFYQTDIFTNPATLYGDGNHPNTAGYERITEVWLEALSPDR